MGVKTIIPGIHTLKNFLRVKQNEETVFIAPITNELELEPGDVAYVNEPCKVTDIKWKDPSGSEHEGMLVIYTATGDRVVLSEDGKPASITYDNLSYMGDLKNIPAYNMKKEYIRGYIHVSNSEAIPIWNLTYNDVRKMGYDSMEDLIHSWDSANGKGDKWTDCPLIYRVACTVRRLSHGFAENAC